LYFPNNKFLYNTMMTGVWLFRPSTISPWVRRRLHLHHHKLSGTESDLEEIAITNGEPWGLRRVLMTADGMLAIALRPGRIFAVSRRFVVEQRLPSKEARRRVRWETRLGYAPLGLLYYPLWHATLALAFIRLAETATGPSFLPSTSVAHLLESLWPGRGAHVAEALQLLAVVVLMPNALRSFCLNFVSSNIHYFGDIEGGNIVQQTQVWTAPWTWPFQLFCFNFGGTHAIHHFVVNDPFYIRQAIAKDAHAVMKKHGVRFNDFGTFRRNNRWETEAPAKDHLDAGTNGHDNREGNFASAV